MIRVLRAEAGETFSEARQGKPLMSGVNATTVLRQLPRAGLDEPTASAVKRALAELDGADADVVVVAGASVYRIFPGVAAPEPVAAAPHAAPWTREKGAPVLVAGTIPELASLTETLGFLGYDARLAPSLDGGLRAALAEHKPLATLVAFANGDGGDRAHVIEECRAHGGILLLGADVVTGDGVDGVVPVPIVTSRLAALLDPVVSAAKARRAGG